MVLYVLRGKIIPKARNLPCCNHLSFSQQSFNAYYQKKREQGKHHLTATGAVARKLTIVIYAVLRDSKPYEPKKFC